MPRRSTRAASSDESTAHAGFARLIAGAMVVLVVLMVGRIYWRWHSVNEPSTVVIIGGDGSLEGARIEVRGQKGGRWTAELDSSNGWQTPILLDPGEYHLTVTHRNLVIRDENFTVDRTRGMRFDLPSMVIVIGGFQLADARIEIVCDPSPESTFTHAEIKLDAKDHYRKAIYLFPGSYHAIARNALKSDRVLAQVDFTVDRTAPVRVDLVKAANEDGAP